MQTPEIIFAPMPPMLSGDDLRRYCAEFHEAVERDLGAGETQTLFTLMCSAADELARWNDFAGPYVGPIYDGIRRILAYELPQKNPGAPK